MPDTFSDNFPYLPYGESDSDSEDEDEDDTNCLGGSLFASLNVSALEEALLELDLMAAETLWVRDDDTQVEWTIPAGPKPEVQGGAFEDADARALRITMRDFELRGWNGWF